MSDSFFGFDAGFSALGSRKYDPEELLTADVEEEYDALNDETFGDATFDADWEEDHEKLAHLIKDESAVLHKVSNDGVDKSDGDPKKKQVEMDESQQPLSFTQEIVERSISHLGLEDDLDMDPAIMTFGRSEKCNRQESSLRFSPPPPAILDAEVSGSPKTRSIWSTLDVNSEKDHNVYSLFTLLESESPASAFNKDSRMNSSFPISPSMPSNARTVEELECDLISHPDSWLPSSTPGSKHSSQQPVRHSLSPSSDANLHAISSSPLTNDGWWYSSSKDGQLGPNLLKISNKTNEEWPSLRPYLPVSGNVRTLEDVEKDILLRPRAQTVEEVERHLQAADRALPRGLPPTIPDKGHRYRSPASNTTMTKGAPGIPIKKPLQAGTSPISIITRSGQVGNLPSRLGPQMSPPPILPPHPILNPPRMGPPFPLGSYPLPPGRVPGKPIPLHVHGPSPGFPPGTPNIPSAPLDMRRLLYPRHIHHPLLNKQLMRNNFSRAPKKYQESDKSTVNGTEDEYAGLMTPKEKEWLIKIQLLQLQTDNPYVTDFYFMTYQMRKIAKEKALAKSGEEPQLLLPEIAKQELKVYVPRQFEGSLGKLQVASVNYPRKILEEGVHRPTDDEETKFPTNSELYWFRKLLMDIEKLYLLLLEIDDEDKRISALSEEAQITHKELRKQLVEKLYAGVVNEGTEMSGDRFPQIASVRKGRQLIMRCLPAVSQHHKIGILKALFSNLGHVLRKDHLDHVLQQHLEYVLKILHASSAEDLISLGQSLQNLSSSIRSSPSRERSQYMCAFQSTFGSTVICTLLIHLEKLYATELENDPDLLERWTNVVLHIVDVLCTLPDSVLAPSLQFAAEVEAHLFRFLTVSENKEVVRHKLQILSSRCNAQ